MEIVLPAGHRARFDVIAAAAAEREAADGFPRAYVARVRTAAASMSLSATAGDDGLRSAAFALEAQSLIDVDVPTAGASRARRLVKVAVKKAVGWYLRFVGDQVSVLARSAARLGLAVADRVERLDADQAALRAEMEAEIARLRARVAELEARP